MATIARIIVNEPGLPNHRLLFQDFIAASKTLLPKGAKHQFVLLPGGCLTFPVKNDLTNTPLSEPTDKTARQKWNADIEALKAQALAEFHQSFDSKMLQELQSVAHHLVIGINSEVVNKEDIRIQLVLVYDLQSGKPLHWTGKTFPNANTEQKYLIKMPIETHFMKEKIGGKKIAVFGCHDLSIFNPRHQWRFSPFDDERKGEKRKENTPTGKIKCPFIDATLDFCPEIMLQLPHDESTWAAKWTKLNKWLQRKNGKELQLFASGLRRSKKRQYPLSGTQRGDVINFVNGKWVDGKQK